MVTSKQALEKFGPPELERNMSVLALEELRKFIPALPSRVYCNNQLKQPLLTALDNVVKRGLFAEIKSWNGCFNIRKKKAGSTPSLHSWGLAIDINAADNGFNKPPTMSRELVQCFKDAGFDWGGDWRTPDGMHFQLSKLG